MALDSHGPLIRTKGSFHSCPPFIHLNAHGHVPQPNLLLVDNLDSRKISFFGSVMTSVFMNIAT